MDSKSGTDSGTLTEVVQPIKDAIPLKELWNIVKKEGWTTVDPELAKNIKTLVQNVKEQDSSLTLTAFIEHPVTVSYIHTVKEDGTRKCLAIGSGSTSNEATASSVEAALRIVKRPKKKDPSLKDQRQE